MAEIAFGFKAVKPIRAEHPIGSGKIVEYGPGDEVPAGDWGRAADALVENGKLMRYAMNVYGPGEFGGSAPPVEGGASAPPDGPPHPDWPGTPEFTPEADVAEEDPEVKEERLAEAGEGEPFPQHQGGGYFLLSDGSQVRGKQKAFAAQAQLDVATEA